ncbi:MAG: hypothetical protein IKW83_03595 [Muribaculaceae bacterium]|nr:hypothetical protein [Muribaculaceae bacterium]
MNQAKLLMRHAFILYVLCLVLGFALLFLGKKDLIPYWLLVAGTVIVFVAFVAWVFLLVKARKLDRAECRRVEAEILKNAAKEDAVDKAIENGDIVDEVTYDQSDYKNDDEQ